MWRGLLVIVATFVTAVAAIFVLPSHSVGFYIAVAFMAAPHTAPLLLIHDQGSVQRRQRR